MDAMIRLWLVDAPVTCALQEPGGSSFNLASAAYVKEFLVQPVLGTDYRDVLARGATPQPFFEWSDVAILTPYSARREYYNQLLKQVALETGFDEVRQLEVSTIDGFQ